MPSWDWSAVVDTRDSSGRCAGSSSSRHTDRTGRTLDQMGLEGEGEHIDHSLNWEQADSRMVFDNWDLIVPARMD